jgi:hypothetical protein
MTMRLRIGGGYDGGVKSRLFTFAASVSLLLFAATMVLWARNIHSEEQVLHRWSDGIIYVGVCGGRVLAVESHGEPNAEEDRGIGWYRQDRAETLPEDGWDDTSAAYHSYAWHGFGYEWNAVGPSEFRHVTVPAWFAAFMFLLLPVGRVWYAFKTRLAVECCAKCFYTLTGNTSGTCPECGTAISLRERTNEA